MRLCIVGTKGGLGKSTTALGLAVAATQAGRSVTLVDLDPQRSLTQAHEEALEDGPVPWTLSHDLNATGEVVIIDTGPHDLALAERVLAACDVGVTPCSPSPFEIQQLPEVLSIGAKVGKDVIVLPVRTRAGTRSTTEFLSGLDETDVLRMETVIPLREAILGWFGVVPTELHGYDAAWAELAGYLKSLSRRRRRSS